MSSEGVVPRSLVSIVDDDESVRESLPELIRQFGLDARTFASAEAFLASEFVNDTSCLVLDIAMPGMSGSGTPAGSPSCLRQGRSFSPAHASQFHAVFCSMSAFRDSAASSYSGRSPSVPRCPSSSSPAMATYR